MKFHALRAMSIWSIINIIIIIISDLYFSLSLTIFFSLPLLLIFIYSLSTDITIIESKLIVRKYFYRKEEIEINDIRSIEAVTERKAGYIYIHIGKKSMEDYYILQLKNRSKIAINAYLLHDGESVGRYLKRKYKIAFMERVKTRYIYGNP